MKSRKLLALILSALMVFALAFTGCAAICTDNTESDGTASDNASEGTPTENADEASPSADLTTVILGIGNPVMTVNGTEKPIDAEGTSPVIRDNRTLLPVRAVIEEFGGSVEWDGDTRTVTLLCGGTEVKLTIDSTAAYVGGEERTLDVAPVIIGGRTMLPIRFVSDCFDIDVKWDGEARTVTLTAAKKSAEDSGETPGTPDAPESSANRAIVVYFSATGTTKTLAGKIAEEAGADIFEIVPEEPYTSEDLNYGNSDCRANLEQHDDSARPAISALPENLSDYGTVFVGYPIWWGTMPKIINTFLESTDLAGKTIMPFCTSGGSGISTSVSAIRSLCPDSEVKDGFRGSRSTDAEDIAKWFDDEGFKKADESAEAVRVKLTWDGGEAVLALVSNKTTEDFVSRLPFTLTMEDYAGTEKIGRFSEALYKDTDVSGLTPTVGTAAIYAPWGNLAVFYGSASYSKDLIPVGSIESGLDALSSENDNFEVTFTLLESAK